MLSLDDLGPASDDGGRQRERHQGAEVGEGDKMVVGYQSTHPCLPYVARSSELVCRTAIVHSRHIQPHGPTVSEGQTPARVVGSTTDATGCKSDVLELSSRVRQAIDSKVHP